MPIMPPDGCPVNLRAFSTPCNQTPTTPSPRGLDPKIVDFLRRLSSDSIEIAATARRDCAAFVTQLEHQVRALQIHDELMTAELLLAKIKHRRFVRLTLALFFVEGVAFGVVLGKLVALLWS